MSILIRLANKNTLKKGLGFILIMTLVFSLIPSNSLTIEAATESENEQVNVTQPNNNEDNSKEDTGATDNTEGNAEDASEGNSSNSTNTSEGDADTEEAEIVNRVLGVSALDLSEATVEDIADQVYTGSEITPDVTVKYSDTTLVKGTDYTVTYTDNINVSTDDTKAKVTIEAVSGSVYSGSITKEFTITAANSEVAKAPEANTNLMYTAAEQALVTAGEANNGTMKYVLGNDSQNVPESGWSSDIPTGENEGTYYVWYKVFGNDNYNDTEAACVTVSIGQAESYFRINTKANTVVDLTEKVSTSTNYYNAKIENSSELETLLGITAEEKAQGVNVWADVQNNNYMPPVNKNLINSVLGDYTVGQYLNISLYKKVGNNSATLVSDTNEKVKISINIPESLWGSNRVYGVVGVHNGVPQFLGGTYEESTHKLTFETNGFSPYAIAYKSVSASTATTTSVTQGASATVTEAANYGTPGVSAGTTVKAPKTEDCTSVMMWYMLLLIAGGLLLVSFKSNKRQ